MSKRAGIDMKTSVADRIWESPAEADIEVVEPVTAKAKRYRIIEIVATRSPEKMFVVKADLYDANGNLTGGVVATAQNSAFDLVMGDTAQQGEDYHAHSERVAGELLKAKGKMADDAIMV